MTTFEQLFGEKLITKADDKHQEIETSKALSDKVMVGIYFSAHWCPPCKAFTPKLGETYKALKADNKGFELVFVSSDSDEEAFNGYFGEMPFLALPYADRERKEKLSKKFKLSGIPTLVLLDGEGNLVSTNGREDVDEDPTGAKFPWIPPTFQEIVGEMTFEDATGKSFSWGDFAGKTIGLYFSAHWCPPCQAFTPILADTYKKLKEKDSNFEVIFVSSDRDEDQFKEYFGEMPWLTLPYANREGKGQLNKKFGVEGIPSLVIVDSDGKIINDNARGAVMGDKEGADFPWHPKPVNPLATPDGINETNSLVILAEEAGEAKQKEIFDYLLPIAEKCKEKEEEYLFFVAQEKESIAEKVRQLTSLGEPSDSVQMILLALPEGGFYTFKGDVDAQAVSQFLADHAAGKLTKTSL